MPFGVAFAIMAALAIWVALTESKPKPVAIVVVPAPIQQCAANVTHLGDGHKCGVEVAEHVSPREHLCPCGYRWSA